MVLSIFTFLFIIWVVLLPLYLWAYLVSEYTKDTLSHKRFFLGLLTGSLWTIFVFSFEKYAKIFPFGEVVFFFIFIFLVGISIFFSSYSFSRIWGKFARTLLFAHAVVFLLLGWCIFFLEKYIALPWVVSVFILSFFSRAILEEGAKHLSSIGLLWSDFRFSEKDILFFTLFSVLGFVFAENILYLLFSSFSLGTLVMRSFFTIIIHIFAALVCTVFWWKAMSYRFLSLKYIVIFLFGCLLAWLLHAIANSILASGSIFLLSIMCGLFYLVFLVWIKNYKDN